MKPSKKIPTHEVFSILESDDEIPDSYCEETIENPAYMNDSRFDPIVLPWLENCQPIKATKGLMKNQPLEEQAPEDVKTEEQIPVIQNDKSKILISHGILSTHDLFLVKSIAEYCSESTLIWFIESLKLKSVPDRFHKSCLARDFISECNNNEVEPFNCFNMNYYFNLIVS